MAEEAEKRRKSMRVGVIGVGSMGRNHARIYSELPGVALVGISDIDRRRGGEVAASYGTKLYRDYRELLKLGLDGVSVVVPTHLHQEVAIDAISAGVNVLIEKPIADNVINAQRIFYEAEQRNLKLMVGHIERFNPAVGALYRIIESGKYGKLLGVSTLRLAPYPVRVVDSGIILDIGCHDIDIISYLSGSAIREVYAVASSTIHHLEDHALLSLNLENGTFGQIETSWLSNIKVRKLFASMEGAHAQLDFIDQTLVLYDEESEQPQEVERAEPLKEELKCFVECLRNDVRPPVSGDESIHALGVALGAIESYQRNLPMRIHGDGAFDFLAEVVRENNLEL
jgi:UDP-N-acetylglucosamine 3-dehydrogenase